MSSPTFEETTSDLLIDYVAAYHDVIRARDAHRADPSNTASGTKLQACYVAWDAAASALMGHNAAAYRRAHIYVMSLK